VYGQSSVPVLTVKTDSLNLFDSARNRLVPVALYLPETYKGGQKQKVVILSHGYTVNQPGANRGYSYITENLASKGYFVASIQHELPGDEVMPYVGIPQLVRRPYWERGSANILFVLNELKKRYPNLDYDHLILIGHSNGADMTALFAQQHPELVDKIIELDNRRMALPRTAHPKIYSIRSSDQPADEGVLPAEEERVKFGITIVKLPNTIHNDMGDRANPRQRKEINDYIMQFLNN
jgi:predicted peptidase